MARAASARPARPQVVLTVLRTESISPHMMRVILGGEGFTQFHGNEFSDKYVKLLFADPAHGLVPPYDLKALRAQRPQALPVSRTYTVRWVDPEASELALDFVVHGADGVAGPWAARVRPGAQVVFSGPGGGYRPDAEASWHLLAGDLSALPAIAAGLEAMPSDAVGQVFLDVPDPRDRLELERPEGVQLTWVSGGANPLLDAVRAMNWPDGRVQAFVHGERGAIKDLRRHLTDDRGIARDQLSISAYWAAGRAEDQFQAEKREPVGQI
ncbi:MAG: siderophore-interacting protein [Beutenbergiaceae bacterium]